MDLDDLSVEVSMDIEMNGKKRPCAMLGNVYLNHNEFEIDGVQIELEFIDEEANPDPDTSENNAVLEKAFGMLPKIFIEEIAQTVSQKIVESIDNSSPAYEAEDGEYYKDYVFSNGFALTFNWPFDDWGK